MLGDGEKHTHTHDIVLSVQNSTRSNRIGSSNPFIYHTCLCVCVTMSVCVCHHVCVCVMGVCHTHTGSDPESVTQKVDNVNNLSSVCSDGRRE